VVHEPSEAPSGHAQPGDAVLSAAPGEEHQTGPESAKLRVGPLRSSATVIAAEPITDYSRASGADVIRPRKFKRDEIRAQPRYLSTHLRAVCVRVRVREVCVRVHRRGRRSRGHYCTTPAAGPTGCSLSLVDQRPRIEVRQEEQGDQPGTSPSPGTREPEEHPKQQLQTDNNNYNMTTTTSKSGRNSRGHTVPRGRNPRGHGKKVSPETLLSRALVCRVITMSCMCAASSRFRNNTLHTNATRNRACCC